MSDWETAKETVKATARNVAQKLDELTDKAALYIKIQQVESHLDNLYARLGRLSYRKLMNGENVSDEIGTLLPILEDKIRELDSLQDQYKAL
ncbi:MAG: hypothetical protein IKS35_08445 [Clostridia bacterium]|nr:hypothetical protein [Clostridia bacterium]